MDSVQTREGTMEHTREKRSKDWFKDLEIYQIYPKSFMDSNGDGIGDLPGIISKLDYLEKLGIDAIWLSPIYVSPCYDNGYDIADYDRIDPVFGTIEDLERLRDEAHGRGICLIMDLVVNHTSSFHEWFRESRKSRTGQYSDYYIWKDPKDGKEPNNWASCFGGSAWEYCEERGQYYLHMFAKEQPDLNWKSEGVRKSIFAMIRRWLDFGVDGFRVDAISYLDKGDFCDSTNALNAEGYALDMDAISNRPGTHAIIKDICRILDEYDAFAVGEVNIKKLSDYRDYCSEDRKEFKMAIPFVPPIVEIGTWSPAKMKRDIVASYETMKDDGWWARFLSNHDKPRQVSLYGNDTTYRIDSAKMLAMLMQTLPGTPFIFQGEEIGMTDVHYPSIGCYNDIDTRNAYRTALLEGKSEEEALRIAAAISRDNARTPMQWKNEEGAGFTTGKPWLEINGNYRTINVESSLADDESILSFYRKLIEIRKKEPCLRRGSMEFHDTGDDCIFAFSRMGYGKEFLVLLNFSDSLRRYSLPAGNWMSVISNGKRSAQESMVLKPYEAFLLERR